LLRYWLIVWIRLPTNQGLKHFSSVWANGRSGKSESDFQQIKDWNLPKLWYLSLKILKSESDFQQIKDWNLLIALVQFAVVSSESDFQQIKDWNCVQYALVVLLPFVSESDFQQIKDWNSSLHLRRSYFWNVWIRLPTNQGLKLRTKFRIGKE